MASTLLRLLPLLARPAYRMGKKLFRRKRRGAGRRGGRKKVQNKIHTFVRWADRDVQFPGATGPNLITETGLNQHLAYTFTVDDVVNASDFTNLYDQYRINKITVFLERYQNSTSAVSNFNPNNQKICVVHDYDDANPLTQEDDYLEYSNCRRYNIIGNGSIRIVLYPKILNTVLNVGGSVAQTLMSSNRVWLNTEQDEVPHFGIKMFVPAGISTTDTPLFKVRVKYHLSFKNSK